MPKVKFVEKRDGAIEAFSEEKLAHTINTVLSKGVFKGKDPGILSKTVSLLDKYFGSSLLPSTKDIEDILVDVLRKNKLGVLAQQLTEHKKKTAISSFTTVYGVRDDTHLPKPALLALATEALLKNEIGQYIETPKKCFARVAKTLADVEKKYNSSVRQVEEEFLSMLVNGEFIPSPEILLNAGTKRSHLLSAITLPIEDSLSSIYDTLKRSALLTQQGAQIGWSFSNLRHRGDFISSTKGHSSGAVGFIRLYDASTKVLNEGLRVPKKTTHVLTDTHPDIEATLTAKIKEHQDGHFVVCVQDSTLTAAIKQGTISQISPRTQKPVGQINAKEFFDNLCQRALECPDITILFGDEVRRKRASPWTGGFSQGIALQDNEGLPQGSINIATMIRNGTLDLRLLKRTVHAAVHFLDNALDANNSPDERVNQTVQSSRSIGIGVTGFADALILLGVPYTAPTALRIAEEISRTIVQEARKKSAELAKTRGNFPDFEKSTVRKQFKTMRNSALTAISRTHTHALAHTSPGIEPLRAVVFARPLGEHRILDVHPLFDSLVREKNISKETVLKIARTGSVNKVSEIPSKTRKLFSTIHRIPAEWQVRVQAAFQKHADGIVSTLIKIPRTTTVKDVGKLVLLAHKLKLQSIRFVAYDKDAPRFVDPDFPSDVIEFVP